MTKEKSALFHSFKLIFHGFIWNAGLPSGNLILSSDSLFLFCFKVKVLTITCDVPLAQNKYPKQMQYFGCRFQLTSSLPLAILFTYCYMNNEKSIMMFPK